MNGIQWQVVLTILLTAAVGLIASGQVCAEQSHHTFVYHPIMWRDDLYLVPAAHQLTRAQPHTGAAAEEALDVLLAGRKYSPTSHIANIFPKQAQINSVSMTPEKITVGGNPHLGELNVGARGEWIAVQAIVHTAQAASGFNVEQVKIEIDGHTVDTLSGHVSLEEPVEADHKALWPGEGSFENQHWAHTKLLGAELAGLLRGPTVPEAHVTRKEFIRMCVKAVNPDRLHKSVQAATAFPNPFADVAEGSPLAGWVRTVIAQGMLKPSDYSRDNYFGLNASDVITRREVLVMSTRLAKQMNTPKNQTGAVDIPLGQYPDWLGEYARRAVQLGVLKGYPDQTLRLESPATQAEAASMLLRAGGMVPDGGGQITVLQPGAKTAIGPGQLVMGLSVCGEQLLDCSLVGEDGKAVQLLTEVPSWPQWHPLQKNCTRSWFAFILPQLDDELYGQDRLLMRVTCPDGGEAAVPLAAEESLKAR